MASTFKSSKDQPAGVSNRIERVAITGAGGQFGKHITEALLKTGKHTVTAITRPNSTNTLPSGVHVARVDYAGDDDTALVAALRGQQALIITMAVTAAPDAILKLVRAAARAGVPYVLPNWFGHDAANDALCYDSLLGERRDALLAEITRLGVSAYILLTCNFWYEFSLGGGAARFGFDFQRKTLTWFDNGDVPINTTTWPQCARAVAALLSLKEVPDNDDDARVGAATLSGFRNRSVYVSSFRVTQREMFEAVKRVTGTADADWVITRESARQRWEEGREAVLRGDWSAFPKQLYSRMFLPNGDGDYQSSRGLDNDALGLPVEDLDEWTAVAVRMGENGEVDSSH